LGLGHGAVVVVDKACRGQHEEGNRSHFRHVSGAYRRKV
jgi:hypothetical protein